ncbi:TPA: DUF4479 domain-containing protein, partial [Enterococcus faecium]
NLSQNVVHSDSDLILHNSSVLIDKEPQKVVVAKPGAMMPDGMMIWPGTLRGVDSYGMICSARELHLPNAPAKKGILVLPEDAVVGEAFPK